MFFYNKIRKFFSSPGFHESGGYFEIWKVAYPLIIMSASLTIMQFADRAFLASNSTEDVAAALPAGILYFASFCFFMVTVNFTSAIVAQFFGANDIKSCVKASWNGFYFALFTALLIVFILPLTGALIINFGNHPPEILAREHEYYRSLIPSGAFMCMGSAFFAFFSGRGKTIYIATVNSLACCLNIFLDYIFIFGKLGLPPLGIWGAGAATSLSTMFSFICALLLFLNTDQELLPTRRHRQFKFEFIKKLFSFGTPAGMQVLFDVGAFTFVTFLIGHLSREALAATTIALSINQLSFMPLLGFADATSIICGQFIGRSRQHIAIRVAFRAWRMATLYMVCMSTIYLLLPITLMNLFSPSGTSGIDFDEILKSGQIILALAALFNLFDATKFIFMGALRGAGDTRAVMFISSSCAWLLMVPGTLFMIYVIKSSIEWVWAFLAFYIFFESMLIFWRFRSNRWQKIDLIGHNNVAMPPSDELAQETIPID
ncbi:MATE family efflux transporter [Lentisphaerota bacterium ZTH]|nr:MATE family efflux transporter [Lentisphaerota bacterium]WET06841.1 MATE family efflux transporter [Lentisphaerota bacterium ZTH]